MCSGGFDPCHVGHLRLFTAAAEFGMVVVALNSDAWLTRKKGYVCWPFEERRELLLALRIVSLVIPVEDDDDTVCAAIRLWRPKYFANGGDRTEETGCDAEAELCTRLGVTMLWGVGGSKVRSSSELIRSSIEATGEFL